MGKRTTEQEKDSKSKKRKRDEAKQDLDAATANEEKAERGRKDKVTKERDDKEPKKRKSKSEKATSEEKDPKQSIALNPLGDQDEEKGASTRATEGDDSRYKAEKKKEKKKKSKSKELSPEAGEPVHTGKKDSSEHNEEEENQGQKKSKKQKKRKQEKEGKGDQSRTSRPTSPDPPFMASSKVKNKDQKSEAASFTPVNTKWAAVAAQLQGGDSRQSKFLRLLGAKTVIDPKQTPKPDTGTVHKREAELEQQFNTGMLMKTEPGFKRRGLGS